MYYALFSNEQISVLNCYICIYVLCPFLAFFLSFFELGGGGGGGGGRVGVLLCCCYSCCFFFHFVFI